MSVVVVYNGANTDTNAGCQGTAKLVQGTLVPLTGKGLADAGNEVCGFDNDVCQVDLVDNIIL